MRKILPFVIFAVGCAQPNPKEAIVERQKAIKKEQLAMKDSARLHALDGSGSVTLEEISNSKEVYFNREALKLQKEYDSLEVELKKY